MIVLGILLILVTIKERYDKISIEKHTKINFFINLGKGFYCAIIGLLSILKIISGKSFVNLMILIACINIFIDYKIKNQTNQ